MHMSAWSRIKEAVLYQEVTDLSELQPGMDLRFRHQGGGPDELATVSERRTHVLDPQVEVIALREGRTEGDATSRGYQVIIEADLSPVNRHATRILTPRWRHG